jgi:NTE family protein
MSATKSADLVLEGGGVKGIALVGALHELERAGYQFERIAGTSAGSVAGALVAAGYSTGELRKIMFDVDYRKFRDTSALDRVPLIGKGLSLLFEQGVYEGDYLQEWLDEQLRKRGVTTFADLEIDDPDGTLEADQRFSLVVMVTDLTLGQQVRLPWDYRRLYGLDPRKRPVVEAVRASMSIPFFFEPVTLTNPRTKLRSTLVDGGVLSNYPIDSLDRTDGRQPRWPTFGVKLLPALPRDDAQMFPLLGAPLLPPVQLLKSLVATSIVGHDQTRLNLPWVDARTIRVDTHPAGVVEFGLNDQQKLRLYDNGRRAARAFLRKWNWDSYLEKYRPQAVTRVEVPCESSIR